MEQATISYGIMCIKENFENQKDLLELRGFSIGKLPTLNITIKKITEYTDKSVYIEDLGYFSFFCNEQRFSIIQQINDLNNYFYNLFSAPLIYHNTFTIYKNKEDKFIAVIGSYVDNQQQIVIIELKKEDFFDHLIKEQ